MSVTFWPSCQGCVPCRQCHTTVCLEEAPELLEECCGSVECEDCDHECELAEVPC
jgi:hypothetical protein